MTRGQMMSAMTAREYDEWQAFMSLYPAIGERGAYLRVGTVAAMIASVNRDPKHREPFTAVDVFPWLDDAAADESGEETPDETLARMRLAFGIAVSAGEE